MLHISLVAEKLGALWGFPVTNSLLTAWVTMLVLVLLSVIGTRRLSLVPSNAQSVAEFVVGGLYDFFGQISGPRYIRRFFPLLASLFLFIVAANWVGLLPGVGTIGFHHEKETAQHAAVPAAEPVFTPLLRAATADLNMTVGLAIVAVIAIQFFGFAILGRRYSSKFLNFSSPIMFFLGILELISEFSRIISFAFRLFGNIFAGEVLLAVMAFLMPFVVPLPFLFMELFVGFIQALVFSMLTAVFLNVAVLHGEEHA